tara:strand:+ start:1837 stop:2481 length:645 start_codon:yes stop_codon:yes gene_type:complete
MNEDIQTTTNNTKAVNLKNIFFNNKKSIISIITVIFLALFVYFFYIDYKKDQKAEISNKYNLAIINYNNKKQNSSISVMKNIINLKDSTYSPLALYFLIDNNLIENKKEINQYFDTLINETNLEKEILNLIIYKKGLYNSDKANENELLKIFSPLINSDNLWRSHSLYIIAEYYFSKNEMQKSKEFFNKIIELKNSNPQIKLEAQKRLQRDFSA